MLDSKFLQDIEEKIMKALPEGAKNIPQEVKNTIHKVLQSSFTKLDLVTRAEFDQQTAALNRARQKLEELEGQVKALEEEIKK